VKIAINASILGQHPTGTDLYAENVVARLVRLPQMANHTIDVFSPKEIQLPSNCRLQILPATLGRSGENSSSGWKRFFWNQTNFSTLAKQYDRVYCPTYNSSLSTVGQLITIHDLLALRYPAQHRFQSLYMQLFLPAQIKLARKIICVSECTKQEVLHKYHCDSNKISVVHNGYDPQLFHLHSTTADEDHLKHLQVNRGPFALVVGATYPHKNIELLLNVWAELPYPTRTMTLAIVGGNTPYKQELQELAQKLGFDDRIRFLGYVSNEALASLYRRASMLLYPSRFEGFGLPLLEAMACGCPVICSNTDSLSEVAGDAVLYCDPDDLADWRTSIVELLASPTLQHFFRSKGLERVQSFGWEKTAEQIAQIILQEP